VYGQFLPSVHRPVVDLSRCGEPFFGSPSFGLLITNPPTACRLATFSSALSDGLAVNGGENDVPVT
jgi:hypothetical protein